MTGSQPSGLTLAELRNIGLFGALGDDVLQHLADTLSVSTPAAGETVFHEGDDASADVARGRVRAEGGKGAEGYNG